MRRSDFVAGAAGVGGLVAARSAEAGVIGARRALLSGKQLGVNLLANPSLANSGAGWTFSGMSVVAGIGPGGGNAIASPIGTGSNIGTVNAQQSVHFTAGQVYIASAFANMTQATYYNEYMAIVNGDFPNNYQSSGFIGALNGFTAGTNVSGNVWTCKTSGTYSFILQINGCTVNSGQYAYFANPYVARIA